jgi:two-component system, cell cycle sensor histidine kinase and response regulator CckA
MVNTNPLEQQLKEEVKRLRQEIKEQTRQIFNEHRAILNAIRIGISLLKNRILQWANPAFSEMFGYEPDEISGINSSQFYTFEEDFQRVGQEGYAHLSRGEVYATEALMKRKNGSQFWCSISGQAINPDNLEEGSLWALHDITDRKRVEMTLRESEERFSKAFHSSPAAMAISEIETYRIIDVNKKWTELMGYSREEIIGNTSEEFVVWADKCQREKIIAELDEKRSVREVPISVLTKSGVVRETLFYAECISLGHREVALSSAFDITERKRAEEALQTSEDRFRRLLQNSNDIILVLDSDCIQTSVDGPIERILGFKADELIGTNGLDYIHPGDLERVRTILTEALQQPAATRRVEYRIRHKNGGWVTVEAVGINLLQDPLVKGILLNSRDISERKHAEEERSKLQEQLQQAMKMEAVGRLAGGIAHDFNNLLTAISGNVELARLDLESPDHLALHLDEINKAAESATSLTRQLLAFSRRQIIEPKVVSLNELIVNLQKMLIRLIGEDISLYSHLEEALGSVQIDPGQFEQVLINLAINARDAMPNGGKLHIETANLELDEKYCKNHREIHPGKYVFLAMSDTGQGMSEEVKRHLFEPFFTTKPKGHGTGLGLATIFGIVKQAGGSVEVYSEVGLGTTIKIYLPRIEKQAKKLTQNDVSLDLVSSGETILLVEDEASVRELALVMLKRLGYKAFPASNAEEAFRIQKEYPGRIDLLMTDVVMPGMNGRELSERLLPLQPEMKVLFTSGYTEDVVVHHGIVDQSINFISKPYSMQALARKIREVLGSV